MYQKPVPGQGEDPSRSITNRLAGALEASALGRRADAILAELRCRRAPLRWSRMFGAATVACVLVLFATGIALMFFYVPSGDTTIYHGVYRPLRGTAMSEALESTIDLSFEVRGGLLLRQLHHWAALLLPASILIQLLVTFFTGGFRRPRRLLWIVLVGILLVALLGGWSGYAMPDDLLAGTGLQIFQGILLAVPVAGAWLSSLLFSGGFPGRIIEHLYPIHVALAPVLLILLMAIRAWLTYRTGSMRFASIDRSSPASAGPPLWPHHATRSAGMLSLTTGVLLLVASVVTIDPVWLYGPADPAGASAGSQPDWYTGFLDGALRLVPPGWELTWGGRTWTLSILVPLAVVTGFILAVVIYPFFEEWLAGDRQDHSVLDRPRNTPSRTATGAAAMVFFGALWGAGSADIIATHFQLGVESVVGFFQCVVVLGPFAAFSLARRICLGLERRERETVELGYETGRIVRMPGGAFVEVREPLSRTESLRLQPAEHIAPLAVRPDTRGRRRLLDRLHAALWLFFFDDRIVYEPSSIVPTPTDGHGVRGDDVPVSAQATAPTRSVR
jgi:ubiquinol-cytochrome c reductase cytochrome b subunit